MVYVPPKYPAEIPTIEDLPDRVDDLDWLYAARYNELKKELRAALTELGTLPKGEYADVKTRLDAGVGGDVYGPASAVDNRVVRFDGTSGKIIQSQPGPVIDDNGYLTNHLQPGFSYRHTASQGNIAINVHVTVVWDTTIYDPAGLVVDNVFTAPKGGKYLFTIALRIENLDRDADYFLLYLRTSNRDYYIILDPGVLASDPVYWNLNASFIADMDASDTAYVTLLQGGGAVQTDIEGYSFWSGALLY